MQPSAHALFENRSPPPQTGRINASALIADKKALLFKKKDRKRGKILIRLHLSLYLCFFQDHNGLAIDFYGFFIPEHF
jgi:hypothetical protein